MQLRLVDCLVHLLVRTWILRSAVLGFEGDADVADVPLHLLVGHVLLQLLLQAALMGVVTGALVDLGCIAILRKFLGIPPGCRCCLDFAVEDLAGHLGASDCLLFRRHLG